MCVLAALLTDYVGCTVFLYCFNVHGMLGVVDTCTHVVDMTVIQPSAISYYHTMLSFHFLDQSGKTGSALDWHQIQQ